MTRHNLRHFRVFLAVAELRSPSAAARRCRVSQPAVTQSLNKLERTMGGGLFQRTRQGFFLTDRGRIFEARIRRAMDRLDSALHDVAPRLTVTATLSQLQALIAMTEAQNFTLAAHHLGLAQPTVHRAVTQIEEASARVLFERTSFGMVATRPCRRLAQAARLAFAEFEQAEGDLAEFDGRDAGHIVVGALPLSRTVILPEALARFRALRPRHRVRIFDGPYDEMLAGLRRGDIDLIIGALRDPLPIEDVVQEKLFSDRLTILAGPQHPLAGRQDIALDELARHGWVVPREGVPARAQFDALFLDRGLPLPDSIVECGSILLMRELLNRSDLLGCISAQQAEAEIARGLLTRVRTGIDWAGRDIGLTCRVDWVPTAAQALFLDLVRSVAQGIAPTVHSGSLS
ncbi:LysR family transcriptional regulator [Roseinatronobacter alkalisoli]|uniref:LysR family transcriptional regulator n=1 Tax=Roseinatronobacter alkalisoli TaxID=3028235 RepID=A0ABT5T784_9RHOB|nr:LysR family transcriptional regulator [Roseinatronobacter sp. HJB301]MDD7970976.1 LysR family transcriptional regulator [Roseinatronobacter sp. HJB301]